MYCASSLPNFELLGLTEKDVRGRVEVLPSLQNHPEHQRESPLGLHHQGGGIYKYIRTKMDS